MTVVSVLFCNINGLISALQINSTSVGLSVYLITPLHGNKSKKSYKRGLGLHITPQKVCWMLDVKIRSKDDSKFVIDGFQCVRTRKCSYLAPKLWFHDMREVQSLLAHELDAVVIIAAANFESRGLICFYSSNYYENRFRMVFTNCKVR